MPTQEPAAIEERVARHLADNDWGTERGRTSPWEKRSPKFREDYLNYAREVLAIVQETAGEQIREAIEQAVYEYRELTCQWDEADGTTQEIARRSAKAALREIGRAQAEATADTTGYRVTALDPRPSAEPLPEGHPIPWSQLVPHEQQQGGYWLYPCGCDVYGNGRVWVSVPAPKTEESG